MSLDSSAVYAKIGFDDQFIYEELEKTLSQRKIPMEQLMRDEAIKVFLEWEQKQDKIRY